MIKRLGVAYTYIVGTFKITRVRSDPVFFTDSSSLVGFMSSLDRICWMSSLNSQSCVFAVAKCWLSSLTISTKIPATRFLKSSCRADICKMFHVFVCSLHQRSQTRGPPIHYRRPQLIANMLTPNKRTWLLSTARHQTLQPFENGSLRKTAIFHRALCLYGPPLRVPNCCLCLYADASIVAATKFLKVSDMVSDHPLIQTWPPWRYSEDWSELQADLFQTRN